MTSWHHPGFFFVLVGKDRGWGMKPVVTTPLGRRVKVDISLYKSVIPAQIYVLLSIFNAGFSCY
jgi:hypothetical protein